MDEPQSIFAPEPDHGDCYLTEAVIGNVGALFKGVPANPFSLIDLCQVIEAAVSHEQLFVVGWAAKDNPFAEQLHSAGIIRSFVDEADAALRPGQPPPTTHVLWKAIQTVSDVLLDPNLPLAEKLFHISLYDDASDRASRAIETFEVFSQLLAARSREQGDELRTWFDNEVSPQFHRYMEYVDNQSEIMRHYEMPIISSTVEQPLLDHSRLDIALPHDLLVQSYGKHFWRQVGATFEAIPAPPLAGLVLRKAKSVHDVVDSLLAIREGHQDYRQTLARLRRAMYEARHAATTRGWMEYRRLQNEVETVIEKSLGRVESGGTPKRKLVFRIWDFVKSGNPLKIGTDILDALIEREQASEQVLRVEGIFEVVSSFPDIPFLDASAERLFGTRFDPESISAMTKGIHVMDLLYGMERNSTGSSSRSGNAGRSAV